MEIGWNFPLNNDGPEIGLNDAGIETFRGKRLEALAREINQNSCDARSKEAEGPVEVHFNLHTLPLDVFPQKAEYIEILKSCSEYWRDIEKSKKFFDDALDLMMKSSISVLKISDYNTTGLSGSKLERGSNWHSLTKAIGVSNKDSVAGGSYGIGKQAPFACSAIRTVFYGTKDEHGNKAFQGVGKLATHLKDGQATQGTGYFGITKGNKPLLEMNNSLDDFFQRDSIGTDIFVMGFNGGNDWESNIVKSILESFFYAIHEERLVVNVGRTVINSQTLPLLLKQYTKDDADCLSYRYYQAITRGKHCKVNIKNYDEVELYLLEGKGLPKKIAMVRGTGMKIFDKGHFRGLTKFSGVMIAKGPKINKLLRAIEPPSHDCWQPERNEENVSGSKKVLKDLYSWISKQVRDLSSLGNVEELDIEGVSQYLPDDTDVSVFDNSDKRKEDEATLPKEVTIETIKIRQKFDAKSVTSIGQINVESGEQINVKNPLPKKRDKRDNTSSESRKKPIRKGTTSIQGTTSSNNPKKTFGNEDAKPPLELKAFRSFCTDPKKGVYQISYTPSRDGIGYFVVNIAGEQGEEEVKLKRATKNQTSQNIKIKEKNHIGPVEFKANTRESITLTLDEAMRCALGVVMYEGQ
ncbi:hypothetical protein [Priestia megaterium]|uniref:hypothetical protein n=1 Tax=Priestia megaterium TaxID=1404 RepID=UPI002041AAFE|nr:hypothetical protein [Priestia megaterium]MCM3186376.1 hypothetical protein [Priestia megaterium]